MVILSEENAKKIEDLTDEVIAHLIKSQLFQALWTKYAKEEFNSLLLNCCCPHQKHSTDNCAVYKNIHFSQARNANAIEKRNENEPISILHNSIVFTIEALKRATSVMSYKNDEVLCNNGWGKLSSELFTIKLQTQRLYSLENAPPSSQMINAKTNLIARQLSYLMKKFTATFFSSFSLNKCLFFATLLCQQLFQFGDIIIRRRRSDILCESLLLVINQLSSHVASLKQIYDRDLRKLKRFKSLSSLSSTIVPTLMENSFAKTPAHRKKGYLISPDLVYARTRKIVQ